MVDFREWLGLRRHSPLHLLNLVGGEVEFEVSTSIVVLRGNNLRSGKPRSSKKTGKGYRVK
jgi:hypothetical protein